MALDAEAARFLAADNDWLAFHQRADEFETNRRLVNLYAEQFGDGIDLMARRNRAHDCAGPAAVLLQVIQREREHLVRREPGAAFVHDAETISVAIKAETDLRLAAA